MVDTKDYDNLPSVSPMGAPLDWAWLRGANTEWGVHPKPGPRWPDRRPAAAPRCRRRPMFLRKLVLCLPR